MVVQQPAALHREIAERAAAFGADLVGIAAVADLKRSPSHRISGQLDEFHGVGTQSVTGRRRGIVQWPDDARSAVVIALAHPPSHPQLDWWVTGTSGGNTAGNRKLVSVVRQLADWLERKRGVRCLRLPYHIEKGSVFMKDAAVLAGLGCIGRNNLLITPRFGPRVRLRVMLMDRAVAPSQPTAYDPCKGCAMPCRQACPRRAFAKPIYASPSYGCDALPGRSGDFDRWACNRQMTTDETNAEALPIDGTSRAAVRVAYCRACELACPVGSDGRCPPGHKANAGGWDLNGPPQPFHNG